MNKKLLATIAALAVSTVGASAFTITFNGWGFSDPPAQFMNSAGELTNGITAQIVTFDSDPVGIAGDFAALTAGATVHAEGTSADVFGSPASVATDSGGNVSGIEGDALYLFAFLDSSWFLGTSDAGNWVGGGDDPLAPTVSLDASEVNVVHYGAINTLGGTANHIQVAPIPEPSTYALMIAGFAGMIIYFRRRK